MIDRGTGEVGRTTCPGAGLPSPCQRHFRIGHSSDTEFMLRAFHEHLRTILVGSSSGRMERRDRRCHLPGPCERSKATTRPRTALPLLRKGTIPRSLIHPKGRDPRGLHGAEGVTEALILTAPLDQPYAGKSLWYSERERERILAASAENVAEAPCVMLG